MMFVVALFGACGCVVGVDAFVCCLPVYIASVQRTERSLLCI